MELSYQVEITELVIMYYLFLDVRQTIFFISPRCSKSSVVINCSHSGVAQLSSVAVSIFLNNTETSEYHILQYFVQ